MNEYKFQFPGSIEYRREGLQQSVRVLRIQLMLGLGLALLLFLAIVHQYQRIVPILAGLIVQIFVLIWWSMIGIRSQLRRIRDLERIQTEFDSDPAIQTYLAKLDG